MVRAWNALDSTVWEDGWIRSKERKLEKDCSESPCQNLIIRGREINKDCKRECKAKNKQQYFDSSIHERVHQCMNNIRCRSKAFIQYTGKKTDDYVDTLERQKSQNHVNAAWEPSKHGLRQERNSKEWRPAASAQGEKPEARNRLHTYARLHWGMQTTRTNRGLHQTRETLKRIDWWNLRKEKLWKTVRNLQVQNKNNIRGLRQKRKAMTESNERNKTTKHVYKEKNNLHWFSSNSQVGIDWSMEHRWRKPKAFTELAGEEKKKSTATAHRFMLWDILRAKKCRFTRLDPAKEADTNQGVKKIRHHGLRCDR